MASADMAEVRDNDGGSEARRAVITGATGAIGSAVTRSLLARGDRVGLIARNARHLERLAAHLPAGSAASTHAADVAHAFELVEARDDIIGRWGPTDLLVVSAGVLRGAPFETAIPAEWDAMLQVNLKGLLQTVQIFAPDILAAGERGERADIVLIGTGLARARQSAYSVYSSLGAATDQLSKHLRTEFGPRGVRVHYVAPLFTYTELGRDMSADDQRAVLREEFATLTPISPDSVAASIDLMTALPPHVNLAQLEIQPTGSL